MPRVKLYSDKDWTNIHVRIRKNDKIELERIASLAERSQAYIINQAVSEYIKNHKND